MDLAGSEFSETDGEKLALYFNPAHADKLFAGSGHNFQELAELGQRPQAAAAFSLTASIRARARLKTKVVMSSNLVARLPGNDPQLKNEYVVLSAHIDHVGIGERSTATAFITVPWTTQPVLPCCSTSQLL
jgi:hypothetical protein